MNKRTKIIAVAGIPLAAVSLAVASIAFAAQPVAVTQPVSAPQSEVSKNTASVHAQSDTDIETNDDAVSAQNDVSGTDTETNDDANGPQEAPGMEQAD